MSVDTMLEIVDETALFPYEDTDDGKQHRTHIVRTSDNTHFSHPEMTPQDVVDTARLLEIEIVALCGYKWVPKRDPDRYPLCQACLNRAQQLMRSTGD